MQLTRVCMQCMQEMQTKSNSGAPSLKRLKRAEEKLPEKKVDQDEAEEVAASVLEDLKQVTPLCVD
jgi:hypothetical protein